MARTYPPLSGGIAAAHYHLASSLKVAFDVKVFAYDDDRLDDSDEVERRKSHPLVAGPLRWWARRKVTEGDRRRASTACEGVAAILPAIHRLNGALRRYSPDYILCPDNQLPAFALKKPAGSRLVWVAHHNYLRFVGNPLIRKSMRQNRDLRMAHALEKKCIEKADAIVAVSDYMKDVTEETLSPKTPVTVIKNCVNAELLDSIAPSSLRSKLGLGDDKVLVYIPSAGSSIKGERFVCELVRRLGKTGKVGFFLSGNIPSSLAFELDRTAKNIPIYMPGHREYEENLKDVAACDLGVSPTLVENLSSAFIEALALSVPMISFEVGGNAELISHGVNGMLVPYLDIEAMVNVTRELIDNDELRGQMTSQCQLLISDLTSDDRVVNEYSALFSSVSKDG